MKWLKVLPASELPEGKRRSVRIEGHNILLIHHEGEIYASVNACPHLGLPLKGGKITEDEAIVCPFHHSAFDLKTGDVKAWSPWPPAVGRMLGAISREKTLKIFPTRVEDDSIWIGLEE